MMPILLTEAAVQRLLPLTDLIGTMEAALMQYSTEGVQQPLRTVLQIGTKKEYFGVMPAYISVPGALGVKVVTFYKSNAERSLPTHLATVLLFDPETGAILALMDGRYITEARTAAV